MCQKSDKSHVHESTDFILDCLAHGSSVQILGSSDKHNHTETSDKMCGLQASTFTGNTYIYQ